MKAFKYFGPILIGFFVLNGCGSSAEAAEPLKPYEIGSIFQSYNTRSCESFARVCSSDYVKLVGIESCKRYADDEAVIVNVIHFTPLILRLLKPMFEVGGLSFPKAEVVGPGWARDGDLLVMSARGAASTQVRLTLAGFCPRLAGIDAKDLSRAQLTTIIELILPSVFQQEAYRY